jgi:aminopeptidase N
MCSPQSAPSPNTERGAASLAVSDGPASGRALGVGLALLVLLAAARVPAQQPDAVPPSGVTFDVRHYAVTLDLAVAEGTITGTERIELTVDRPTSSLIFDSGTLVVDSVTSGRTAMPFRQAAQRLIVTLPVPARAGDRRRLDIAYHGAPRTGLTLLPQRAQAYTTFSTSQWMPVVNAPGDRATLDLKVSMPAGWRAAGSGREIERRSTGGKAVYRWRQARETASFLFGFVAGDFVEATSRRGSVSLRYLGSPFSSGELHRIFRDTPDMLAFFEERAGLPYPGDSYTQALVATSGGQELAGLSHMSEDYGRSVFDDAAATGLIAHELAHQWWGDLVTNRDWTHFWLNEGVATFMAAAYKERARGRDAYLADVDGWRRRVGQLRAAGRDKPLVFPEWNRPTADDRAVVYQKGALALHELRQQLGDAAFWAAFRAYTQAHAGQSVTSADLQRAFETSSGRDLRAFFDEWVRPR